MSLDVTLHPLEKMVLRHMVEAGKELTEEELAKISGLSPDQVRRAVEWLRYKKLVSVRELTARKFKLGENAIRAAKDGLPELILLRALKSLGGACGVRDLRSNSRLEDDEFNAAIGRLVRDGYISVGGGSVRLLRFVESTKEQELIDKLYRLNEVSETELSPEELKALNRLLNRPRYLNVIEERRRLVRLNKDVSVVSRLVGEVVGEVTQLTSDDIKSGRWRRLRLARLDVRSPAPALFPGKRHPLVLLIKRVKEIFLSMGFEEIDGPIIQSSFWNFDALYTPQDHPARELQDTFYLDNVHVELPEPLVVESVKLAHENGGDTGSLGWGYRWSIRHASRALLRTHTTVLTIQAVNRLRERKPLKVFSVGRVFRNEKVDPVRFVEFHQIEGIVKEDNANLRQLMGYISIFYRELGFEKIKFWPTYFPYTEPSLQVMVYSNKLNKWLELGGMGIFRPEVTKPLGVEEPVLAWGLGLERLAMLELDLKDIRTFYYNNLTWLRGVRACQS